MAIHADAVERRAGAGHHDGHRPPLSRNSAAGLARLVADWRTGEEHELDELVILSRLEVPESPRPPARVGAGGDGRPNSGRLILAAMMIVVR